MRVRGLLVLAALAAAVVAAPAYGQAPGVTVGSGAGSVQTQAATGCSLIGSSDPAGSSDNDQQSDNTLPYATGASSASHTTCSDDPRSLSANAAASGSAQVTLGDGSTSISGAHSASATTTNAHSASGNGSFNVSVGVQGGPVDYTLSGGASSGNNGSAQLWFNGELVTSLPRSGTIPAGGGAQVEINASCSLGLADGTQNASCSSSVSFTLDLGDPAPAVAITSGPSFTVAQDRSTFEFAAFDPPPGHYECKVDLGSFGSCSSPVSVGPLPDGDHVFAVRYDPDEAPPGPETERRWTIDTTGPSVRITSAPTGANNPPAGDIVFDSPAGDAVGFTCRLDTEPTVDCSSPHRVSGLAPGAHELTVTGFDAAGNESVPAVARWSVRTAQAPGVAGPPGACTAPDAAKVKVGLLTGIALDPGSCFVKTQIAGSEAMASAGRVKLNGIEIEPAAGTQVALLAGAGAGTLRTTGPVTLVLGARRVPVSTPIVFDGLAQGGVTLLNKTLAIGSSLVFGTLPVAPDLKIELSEDDGGSAKVVASIKLPNVFAAIPGRASVTGLSVEAGFVTSNDNGGGWSLKGKIAEAWLAGRVLLTDLEVGYDDATDVWTGSVGINLSSGRIVRQNLPALGDGATLTAALELGPGGFLGPIRKISLKASNLGKHIGHGVFLQRLGAELSGTPGFVQLKGNGGLSFGPRLSLGALFDGEVVSLDGEIIIGIPTGPTATEPFSITMRGVGKIVEVPVLEQKLVYRAPASIDLTGKLDYTIAGFGIVAQINRGWFDAVADDFSIEAEGRSNLPGILSLLVHDRIEAVLSKTGMAVCFTEGSSAVGFTKVWNGPLRSFVNSCDVGPFRRGPAPPPPPPSPAPPPPPRAARAAATGRSFTIAPRAPVAVVAARGKGAPPKVDVTGPGGARIATPDGPAGIDSRSALLVQDPATDTTWITLFEPDAGLWTVAPRAGSALSGVDVADALPPVRVRARVLPRRARRVLAWSAGRLPGHRLTFVERAGGETRVLLRTARTAGRQTFTPAPFRGRRRTIEVLVTRDGLPRKQVVVARYTAPARPRAGRVVKIVRRAARLSWRAQPGAARYAVAVEQGGRVVLATVTKRARVTLPAAARRGAIVVTVVAMGADGVNGPPSKARLR